MSAFQVERVARCPFCGEAISLLLDLSAGDQTYIEDCEVCCRPMQVSFSEGGDRDIELQVECGS